MTALQLVSQTDWICVTSRWFSDNLASKLGLNAFPLPFEANKVPIYMTWHQSQKNDKGHEWLRNAIKQAVTQSIE